MAPTDGWGSRMSAPRRPSRAVARIVPSVNSTVAPMVRRPATWKSMPRRPMASPPGIGSAASPGANSADTINGSTAFLAPLIG